MADDTDADTTTAQEYPDREGQAEYNLYRAAVTEHGMGSVEAREALSVALAAGWTFGGPGPSGDRRSSRR